MENINLTEEVETCVVDNFCDSRMDIDRNQVFIHVQKNNICLKILGCDCHRKTTENEQ